LIARAVTMGLLVLAAQPARADSLVAVGGGEHCTPSPGRKAKWDVRGPVFVRALLSVVASGTCETFVLPATLAEVAVDLKLPPDASELTFKQLRARAMEALRALAVDVASRPMTRLSGGPPPPPGLTPIDDEELERGIHCAGTRCTITRALVDKLLANTTTLAMSARFVPSIKDGKPNGFKLYAIRPASVYSRLGLENGDTVRTLNGFDMSSPDRALEAYSKLRTATELTVAVERRGTPITFEWTIVP
jgi:hypothetical protein